MFRTKNEVTETDTTQTHKTHTRPQQVYVAAKPTEPPRGSEPRVLYVHLSEGLENGLCVYTYCVDLKAALSDLQRGDLLRTSTFRGMPPQPPRPLLALLPAFPRKEFLSCSALKRVSLIAISNCQLTYRCIFCLFSVG